jgi:hypothetical protein
MCRDRGLALQATLQVEPAGKLLSLVLGSGLVIGSLLIERFDSLQASNLLARKTHVLELPITYYLITSPPERVSQAGWSVRVGN